MLSTHTTSVLKTRSHTVCMDGLPGRLASRHSVERVRAVPLAAGPACVRAVEPAAQQRWRIRRAPPRSAAAVAATAAAAAFAPLVATAPCRRLTSSSGSKARHRAAVVVVAAAILPGAGAEAATPEPLPEGLRIEPATDEAQTDVEYDAAANTVRVPLSALDGGRRTKLVMFTCNRCGGRTARLTNPLAWEKGAVFARCQHCDVWHTLAANNPKIIEEVRYDDPEGQKRRREALYSANQQRLQQEAAAAAASSGDSSGTVLFDGGAGDEAGSRSSGGGSSSAASTSPPQQPSV